MAEDDGNPEAEEVVLETIADEDDKFATTNPNFKLWLLETHSQVNALRLVLKIADLADSAASSIDDDDDSDAEFEDCEVEDDHVGDGQVIDLDLFRNECCT